jgi:hypothetical protein
MMGQVIIIELQQPIPAQTHFLKQSQPSEQIHRPVHRHHINPFPTATFNQPRHRQWRLSHQYPKDPQPRTRHSFPLIP